MIFIFPPIVLGFCWWDVPAFLVLLAAIGRAVVKHRSMKDTEKDLENQLSALKANQRQT